MSDIAAGRISLADSRASPRAADFPMETCSGRAPLAKAILSTNARGSVQRVFRARRQLSRSAPANGCQMMSQLKELIPGAEHWPQFARNRSEQFEARFVMVEVVPSPSLFFQGMAGSRMAIARRTGEGRALFDSSEAKAKAIVALRFVDNRGAPTDVYPMNPNGSPGGITASPPMTAFHHSDASPGGASSARCSSPGIQRAGRRQPLDAHVPQRAQVVG